MASLSQNGFSNNKPYSDGVIRWEEGAVIRLAAQTL